MKRIMFLLLLAFTVVALATCQGTEVPPAATAEPTEEPATALPTAEPTTEATALSPTTEPADLGALTANPWQWVSFTDPLQQFEVETPETYLLTFNGGTGAALGASGTVAIVADCNNASGSYTADGGSLTIEIGPMTMAACPPDSRSDQFVGLLGGAARYFFEDANLYIDLFADGGTMVFAPAGEAAMADDGEGAMAGALTEQMVAQLDAFLQSQVYSDGGDPEGAAPGLVLLVDTPEGRYLNAAGVSSLENMNPMEVDDHLEIGSNSKSFLIAVLMQLQEEGVLSLDDMLGDWLPEQAEQIPNGEEITLRQMAQHTAGIWDYGDPIIGEAAADPDKLEQAYTPDELVQYAADNGAPSFPPGEGWKYSNTGYILLGMVAEKATGQSLADLFQARIFDPLGLETAVLIEGVPHEGEITTQGYWWQDDGTRLNTTNWNVSQGWAAGGLAMTAEDLAAYGSALAAGELFNDAESLEQMLAFDERALLGGAAYGLALQDYGNGYWGHEGQTAGFQSLWYTNPEKGITVAGLTNSAAYSAYGLLNVVNILEGRGLQPFQPVTLLPIADQAPGIYASKWQWVQAKQGSETADIPPGIVLAFAKDGTATVSSLDCGEATGTFTANPQAQIAFDLDSSAITCTGGEPLVQLLEILDTADTWRFENGGLVITVAEGEGEIVFGTPPPVDVPVAEACPGVELPFPRPEPAYTGKLERDFTPFAAVLGAYTPEQAAARESLVSGKTIPELQALMEGGDLTAVDLVIYYLDRIQRYDIDKLNSVLELNPEALEIAQALDDERAAGDVRGPMHGIPVLLKDNIATGDDLHTAAGAAAMLDWDPGRDAFLASRLREAGAVILGKANLSEWANYMDPCMPNGFSTNGGQTRNPYGPFDTLGSSSGSAVAVAADLATVSVGTETQGSIIQPAIANSVVALKTSRGLVSRDYVIPLLPWQDVPGPMGRTVTDVAVLLGAMTGVDENDAETAKASELAGTDFTEFLSPEALAGVRVGVFVWNDEAFDMYFKDSGITDAEQQQNIREAFAAGNEETLARISKLNEAGIVTVEVPAAAAPNPFLVDVGPALEYGFQEAINAFLAGLGPAAPLASLEEIVAFNNEDLANRAPYGQEYLEGALNTAISASEYEALEEGNPAAAREALDELFEQYELDVLLVDFGQLYAPAGYPALTVPSGYTEDGAPQGLIFVGRYLSESQLLAVGYAYEQATQARVAPNLEATMQLIGELETSSP